MSALQTNLRNNDKSKENCQLYENVLLTSPTPSRRTSPRHVSEYSISTYLNQENSTNCLLASSQFENQIVSIITRFFFQVLQKIIGNIKVFYSTINLNIKMLNGILATRRLQIIHHKIANLFLIIYHSLKLLCNCSIMILKVRKMMSS